MSTPISQEDKIRRGAEDSGRYFRHMMEFVGFTPEDARSIRESALVIEKHLPNIVTDFYANLLRYPPTRQHFLRKDGTLDQDYLQKRMHHLTNFWRRTAGGIYDDDYARYVDYVGRAHTSHGADPTIYIAERYVIGQVGFIQHAITEALTRELHGQDDELENRSIRAWNKLMMVILEMLARAYGHERDAESYEDALDVDRKSMHKMAVDTYETGLGLVRRRPVKAVRVATETDIPNGERKLVEVDGVSIGVFHHHGSWYALQNHCLHRGGPVATGPLEGDTLICPWHKYSYNITNGELLVDPSVKLEMYPVSLREDGIYLEVQEPVQEEETEPVPDETTKLDLKENEFHVTQLTPGKARLVEVDGVAVAVYNANGSFYAIADACTHVGGPLNEGILEGKIIECPWHASRFDVTTGAVTAGPAKIPVRTFRVSIEGEIGSVEAYEGD